jgi:hypothetical protein
MHAEALSQRARDRLGRPLPRRGADGSRRRRRAVAIIAAACALSLAAPAARAYEFEIRSLTLGQGYQLRALRPLAGELSLARRRFTQTLTLEIWDIGRGRLRRALHDGRPPRGADVYVSALVRVDHDFGEYTTGAVAIDARLVDAIDLVPELARSSLGLEVLYAFAGARRIAGVLDVELGRQLLVGPLDWWSFDGLTLRAHTPWRFAVEAFGGLRVRDSSPAGSPTFEPDGTGGADCAEYVEGPVPGSGSWRPIDREVPGGGNRFESDYELCPQRDEIMPTFGVGVATEALPVVARVAYRRSMSATPGVIGPVDRFDEPDLGLYPSETEPAPDWGVNEERVSVSAGGVAAFARRRGQIGLHAAAAYSLLHALVDEQHVNLRVRYGAHAVVPEYYASHPTFDGDSIFNVFSTSPYRDLRATYELAPDGAPVGGYARAWVRWYDSEDAGDAPDGAATDGVAAGGQVGARYRRDAWSSVRFDLFHEDGYGGRRTGGSGAVRWRVTQRWDAASRLSVVGFDEDLRDRLSGTSYGAQLGASYRVAPGVALHAVGEQTANHIHGAQTRVIGILDLAFAPEI